jgi:hypothetical protein
MTTNELHTRLIKITVPVMLGKAFQVKTSQTSACFAAIFMWFQWGVGGGFVLGPPRHGKTAAIRWSLKALSVALGVPIPVFEIPVRSHVVEREGDFFSYLLKSLKHRDWKTGTVGARRDRLIDFLTIKARACQLKTVVLYFDEAQFFKDRHWEWLLNMSNEAAVRNIRIFFLFSGPPELSDARESYVDKGQSQLVARFMSVVFDLTGLTTQEELQECLEKFAETVYPPSQKLVLCANFVDPQRYPKFSLPSYAGAMWDQFVACRAAASRQEDKESVGLVLPMHYVTAAILHFLTNLALNQNQARTPEVLLAEAVHHCGFSDFVRSTAYEPTRAVSRR